MLAQATFEVCFTFGDKGKCTILYEMPRAIVIFPKLDGMGVVEHFREQYDPLAHFIPAHITLVFPFKDNISDEALLSHLQQTVHSLATFEVKLRGVTGSDGEYLFLNVKRGNDELIDLHDRLYTGPLAKHLSAEHTYIPHLTLGRIFETNQWKAALKQLSGFSETFSFRVDSFQVYEIYLDGDGSVSLQVSLKPGSDSSL